MSRPNTGTVHYRFSAKLGRDCWQARFTKGNGKRTGWIVLDCLHLGPQDEPAARAHALTYVGDAKAVTDDGKGETVEHYAGRWLAKRSLTARKDNEEHLRCHVFATVGDIPMRSLTEAHGDKVVAHLDAKIADGSMSAKTAKNVWGTVKRMLKDAAHAKTATGLRCLERNPFRDVMPPERSNVKAGKQWMYPDEFLTFVSCPDIPVRWRRNVAIAVFLGLRDGEQRALRWEHVDVEHAVVHVCEVFDQRSKKVRKDTKTHAARVVPIPAPLLPLLEQMRDEAGGTGLVCRGIDCQRSMARGLRNYLHKAGITRASLFETTAVNLQLRWHDLRATCGTWLALLGRGAVEIRDTLGHQQVSMTDRYLRNATAARGGSYGVPFPELPPLNRHSIVSDGKYVSNAAIIQANYRGERASNPQTARACSRC